MMGHPLSGQLRYAIGFTYVMVRFMFLLLKDIVMSNFSKEEKNPYLGNNFAPIHKEHEGVTLQVTEGAIPQSLDGQFVRNGPNPQHPPQGLYHWFDGDGMLHGVSLKNGEAKYWNKWVKTPTFEKEKRAGKSIYLSLRDLCLPRVMVSIVKNSILSAIDGKRRTVSGRRTANTSVEFHAGRFLALMEADFPFQVQLPQLDTLGEYTYDGTLKHNFTAHPKVDAVTGEMMMFGYSMEPPFIKYSLINKEGDVVRTLPIDLPKPVMMHDFAITERYSIIMNLPLTFDKKRIVMGESPFKFEVETPSRFGILPRHAKHQSEVKWFQSTSCYVFHTVNAHEEGDVVVLRGCRSQYTSALGIFEDKENEKATPTAMGEKENPFLYEWRFNMKDGSCTEKRLFDRPCEFPVVNNYFLGRRTRYAWCGDIAVEHEEAMFCGIVKHDFDSGAATTYSYGKRRYGGEAFFCPHNDAVDEDDGSLLSFVYDANTDSSEFVVINAKTMKLSATVKMPQRVPYGFHGKWIRRDQIEAQKSL